MRILAAVVLVLGMGSLAQAQTGRVNGGGSSFVKPMMDKWTTEYAKAKGVEINYQSVGSGAGIEKMIAKEFDFGCTDAPLKQGQLDKAKAAGGDVLHVPLVMGGIVPAYNLPKIREPLRFDGPLLADIFMCKVTRWNDDRIKALNPTVLLPDQEIVVVRRADGSGSTFIFSDFLSRHSKEWMDGMGRDTTLKWSEKTIGAKGTEGVANTVKTREGAIGYVELLYALQNQIPYGAVKNRAGEFLVASLESVSKAADNQVEKIPASFRYSLAAAPGNGAYPISGTVWAVIYTKGGSRGKDVSDFLKWVVSPTGQQMATGLHYAPLPPALAERVRAVLEKAGQ